MSTDLLLRLLHSRRCGLGGGRVEQRARRARGATATLEPRPTQCDRQRARVAVVAAAVHLRVRDLGRDDVAQRRQPQPAAVVPCDGWVGLSAHRVAAAAAAVRERAARGGRQRRGGRRQRRRHRLERARERILAHVRYRKAHLETLRRRACAAGDV